VRPMWCESSAEAPLFGCHDLPKQLVEDQLAPALQTCAKSAKPASAWPSRLRDIRGGNHGAVPQTPALANSCLQDGAADSPPRAATSKPQLGSQMAAIDARIGACLGRIRSDIASEMNLLGPATVKLHRDPEIAIIDARIAGCLERLEAGLNSEASLFCPRQKAALPHDSRGKRSLPSSGSVSTSTNHDVASNGSRSAGSSDVSAHSDYSSHMGSPGKQGEGGSNCTSLLDSHCREQRARSSSSGLASKHHSSLDSTVCSNSRRSFSIPTASSAHQPLTRDASSRRQDTSSQSVLLSWMHGSSPPRDFKLTEDTGPKLKDLDNGSHVLQSTIEYSGSPVLCTSIPHYAASPKHPNASATFTSSFRNAEADMSKTSARKTPESQRYQFSRVSKAHHICGTSTCSLSLSHSLGDRDSLGSRSPDSDHSISNDPHAFKRTSRSTDNANSSLHVLPSNGIVWPTPGSNRRYARNMDSEVFVVPADTCARVHSKRSSSLGSMLAPAAAALETPCRISKACRGRDASEDKFVKVDWVNSHLIEKGSNRISCRSLGGERQTRGVEHRAWKR
jgi:hypothetical protein